MKLDDGYDYDCNDDDDDDDEKKADWDETIICILTRHYHTGNSEYDGRV